MRIRLQSQAAIVKSFVDGLYRDTTYWRDHRLLQRAGDSAGMGAVEPSKLKRSVESGG